MKKKKQIENELEHQKLLFLAIRLLEHYEGRDDLNLDRVERFVSKHSDGDAVGHLEKIFAYQWVLDKKTEVPSANYDDMEFVKFIISAADCKSIKKGDLKQ